MKVSVAIPAYSLERLDDIKRCVDSAYSQTYKPCEVIVAIDPNEELKRSLECILPPEIKIAVTEGVIGGVGARNIAARTASGDVVAFLDDDAWADENWLAYIMSHYDDSVMAVGGKTISVWERGRPAWFPEELDWIVGGTWKGHPEEMCEVRNLIGPNMSFRRSVCDKVGYMRSDLGALGGSKFRAGDETEFFLRMKHYFPDRKILFEPRAIVYHKVYDYKTKFKQLVIRSCSLGYYKSRATKVLKKSTKEPFRLESRFLSYLLLSAIPEKVSSGRWRQAGAILVSIFAVGCGYLWGMARR